MNKKEFVKELSKNTDMTQSQSTKVIDEISRIISKVLQTGEDINLKGLGSFKIVERKARKGRNPKTGEEIKIPKKSVVKFTPYKDLKESVKKTKRKK